MYVTIKSFKNRSTFDFETSDVSLTVLQVKEEFYRREHVPVCLQRLFVGNRLLSDGDTISPNDTVHICLSLLGGKGGFGSMLRAIGAQIEKTTNREACRDLSGRRLRDINEEKRLKEWISKQAEREQDLQKKRIEKLERMKAKPKHEFHDPEYDQQRSELPEKVSDSVLEGLKKDPLVIKRKPSAQLGAAKKKNCMWSTMDDMEGDDSDLSDEENKTEDSNEKNGREDESDGPKKSDDDKKMTRLTFDLSQYESISQLQDLGGEFLSSALSALGAKSGGTVEQKAERLWAFKGKGTLKKLHGPTDIVL